MGQLADSHWDDLFLSAALEPDRWEMALGQMASHSGASHGQLIGIGGERDVSFNIVTNFDAVAIEAFGQAGGYAGGQNYRVAASQQAIAQGFYDPLLYEKHYDAVTTQLPSAHYIELCRQFDIPFGCQTNLIVDGYGLVGLATLRKRRDGRTTAQDRRVFGRAASAARRAVRLQERLEGEQAKFLTGAFDAIGVCAFIIDRTGRMTAHTRLAEDLLSSGDVTIANGMLDADGRPLSLRAAVQALTVRDGGLAHVRLQVHRPPEKPLLLIEGFRLPPRDWSFGGLPHAVLIANPPRRDRAGVCAFLGALYRLTSAEADIALRLLEGRSRATIAQERGVTVETLRGQIKALYMKTGVDGESSLMRLLSGITA